MNFSAKAEFVEKNIRQLDTQALSEDMLLHIVGDDFEGDDIECSDEFVTEHLDTLLADETFLDDSIDLLKD